MTPPPSKPADRLWEWLGWAAAVGFLVLGVPLFLRMPPWCDLTLYDMAARTIMAGGVHYRDVFDTNLPGFVWLLVLVRRTLGPSTEAVRAVDLLIVAAIVFLLMRLAKAGGATRSGIAWLAAGAAAFYPFTSEFCHAQRDVWMFLPAVGATALRLRRLPPSPLAFGRSALEGALWGVAVWIKPHVVFPAAGVWLFSARRLTADGRWRSTRADLLGNLLGGLLVGAAGIAWLVATGTWGAFWVVATKWMPEYSQYVFGEMGWRFLSHWFYFAPWTLMEPLALAMAVCDLAAVGWGGPDRPARWLARAPRWLAPPAADARTRFARGLLAALFVSWVFQSFLFQRQFPYVHVAETLMTLAVFAARGWAVVPLGLAYLAVTSAVYPLSTRFEISDDVNDWCVRYTQSRLDGWIERTAPCHPLADVHVRDGVTIGRLQEWAGCWDALTGQDYDRRQDRLGLENYPGSFPSIGVAEADEVATWLRGRGATADTVICWHSSPHAVYLGLPGVPAFRFMHVDTPIIRPKTYQWMRAELFERALPKATFVVADLYRLYVSAPGPAYARMETAGPDLWPLSLPAAARQTFPCRLRAVFRSRGGHGRYVVLAVTGPVPDGPGAVEYDPETYDTAENVNIWNPRPGR